jgi:uncharacterized membrane protein
MQYLKKKFLGWPVYVYMLGLALAGVVLVWLDITPGGLMGKADAIGYAVCHRIALRSYFFGERQMPLCARCSGMYIGAMVGLLILGPRGHHAGLPRRSILAVMAALALVFAVDGVNSYLHFFPGVAGLYAPQNIFRLVTGIGLGCSIPIVLLPVWNMSIWADHDDWPLLATWLQYGLILLLAGLGGLALLSGNPLLLYPLALLGPFTILALVSMIHIQIWIMILKKEACFRSWREVLPILLLGMTTAFLQILLMDIGRLAITHTWGGFNL